jgi:hypothetical protein
MSLKPSLRNSVRYLVHRFPHLPAVACYRLLRNREIEQTRPIMTAPQNDREALCAVYLTGAKHVPDLLYAAKSLAIFYSRPIRLVILGDSTLGESERARIIRHLPAARIWTRAERDAKVIPLLREEGLIKCLEFREEQVFAARLVDFCLLDQASCFLWLDSDTLALRPLNGMTAALFHSQESSIFGLDPNNAYVFDLPELKQRFGHAVAPHCNAGTCFLHRDTIDLTVLDRWLAMPHYPMSHGWAEQTLIASLASLGRVAYFPHDTYSMGRQRDESICEFIHYCGPKPGPIEVAMLKYGQGMVLRQLLAGGG